MHGSASRVLWPMALLGLATAAFGQPATSVNIRKAGAKGDGIADDAPAIQAAVDASAPGATLFIPSGTYRVGSPLRLKSHLNVIGSGSASSVLRFTGTGNALLSGTDVHDLRVSDLALQGTRSEQEAEENGGLSLRLTQGSGEVPVNLTVERISISGFRSTGLAVTGTGRAVATDITVRDCAFAELGLHGVLGYFVRRYHVEHCRFTRLGRSGTIFPRCWDVAVRDCLVRTTGWHGVEVGDETEGFLIEDNVIEDSGDHAGILVEQAAHRGVITHNRITAPRFQGLQLNNKPARAAVKEVSVTGNLIDMRDSRARTAMLIYGDTTYTVDDCLVEGNTILGGQTGIEAHYLKRCRFDHNMIRGAQTRGLDLVFLNVVAIHGNTITDCLGEGIRIMPYANVFTNSDVAITDNAIFAPAPGLLKASGILANSLRTGSVRGNRVRGFERGIELVQCDGLLLSDNDLRGNAAP